MWQLPLAPSPPWYVQCSDYSLILLLIGIEFPLQLCSEAVICNPPRPGHFLPISHHILTCSPRCVRYHPCGVDLGLTDLSTGQIAASLASLNRTVDDYSALSKKELIKEKQEKAFERVKNFRNELADYRTQFDRLRKEREEAVCIILIQWPILSILTRRSNLSPTAMSF